MPNLSAISEAERRAVLRAFNDVISSVRDSATLSDITELINSGNIDEVLELLQLDRSTFAPLEQAIIDSYRTGGTTAMGQIGRVPVNGIGLNLIFDARSRRAESWLSKHSSRMVTDLMVEQRQILRAALAEGMASGRNPRSTALDIVGRIDIQTRKRTGGVIGLTEQQSKWIANARAELENTDSKYFRRALRDKRFDSTVKKAIESGKPLNQDTIDRAITRMQNRALKMRADAISRTESLNALRAGHHEAIIQVVERGDVAEDAALHEWDATMDKITRKAHADAEGQARPINQAFTVDGEKLMYPGDPAGSAKNIIRCRCREKIVIDFAGNIKKINGFR